MSRRRVTMILHWSVFLLTIFLVLDYTGALVSWAFIASGSLMVALALVGGLHTKPGPGLDDLLRVLHPWLHRVMYAFLAIVVGATTLAQFLPAPLDMERLYFVLLYASGGHGMLQVMRQMSPGDTPLRNMTPRSTHNLF